MCNVVPPISDDPLTSFEEGTWGIRGKLALKRFWKYEPSGIVDFEAYAWANLLAKPGNNMLSLKVWGAKSYGLASVVFLCYFLVHSLFCLSKLHREGFRSGKPARDLQKRGGGW